MYKHNREGERMRGERLEDCGPTGLCAVWVLFRISNILESKVKNIIIYRIGEPSDNRHLRRKDAVSLCGWIFASVHAYMPGIADSSDQSDEIQPSFCYSIISICGPSSNWCWPQFEVLKWLIDIQLEHTYRLHPTLLRLNRIKPGPQTIQIGILIIFMD